MAETIEERYNPAEWNIYGAQASDGDNWDDDSPHCAKILHERIMPYLQYYAYIEITPNAHQALWRAYEELAPQLGERFAMEQITGADEIYPVFRELFSQKNMKQTG